MICNNDIWKVIDFSSSLSSYKHQIAFNYFFDNLNWSDNVLYSR